MSDDTKAAQDAPRRSGGILSVSSPKVDTSAEKIAEGQKSDAKGQGYVLCSACGRRHWEPLENGRCWWCRAAIRLQQTAREEREHER